MQYDESEEPLDCDDEHIRKILGDMQTTDIFVNGKFKCPFDAKLRDGKKDSLIQHAIATSIYGVNSRIRANHMALKLYMMDTFTSPSEDRFKKEKKCH